MLIIQHNYKRAYSIIITAFEIDLALNATFIYLQELYVGVYTFSHPNYEIKWPKKGENKEKRVLIIIRKDLLTKVITETRLNLVNHPYVLALNI
jgi:hypothetical protein